MRNTFVFPLFALLAACGSNATTDAGDTGSVPDVPVGNDVADTGSVVDATDEGMDASADAAADASTVDAVVDAAPDPCGPEDHTWRRCAANPLHRAGDPQPGNNVEISIGDPDVFFDADDGLYKAYWSVGIASSFTARDGTGGIKYAESRDGIQWTVQSEPAMYKGASASDWDYSTTETPCVIKVPGFPADRRYVLFYSGGNDMAVPNPGYTWYQIGVAFSADGKHFTRLPAVESPYAGMQTPYANIDGLILLGRDAFPGTANVGDGLVADPDAILVNGEIHLFFSSLATDSSRSPLAFGVSHGVSTDAVHWTFPGANPIANLAGSVGPSVVYNSNAQRYELFYRNDTSAETAMVPTTFNPMYGLWKATSADLMTWQRSGSTREITWDGSYPEEQYGWIATGDMFYARGEYRWYYSAFDGRNAPAGFVVPTHNGYPPAVIVLDLARRLE